MCLITGNKIRKKQAKVMRKTKVQSQQKNFEKFKLRYRYKFYLKSEYKTYNISSEELLKPTLVTIAW
jgi:hypothetical protein